MGLRSPRPPLPKGCNVPGIPSTFFSLTHGPEGLYSRNRERPSQEGTGSTTTICGPGRPPLFGSVFGLWCPLTWSLCELGKDGRDPF